MEFGGSGEDSFVAVVVTKLTGALLFILLLTMVIMALLPKAVDSQAAPKPDPGQKGEAAELAVTTPATLPEAIAGRPYSVALAARGGSGSYVWSMISGKLPAGLDFNSKDGRVEGTPEVGTPEPARLVFVVSDGEHRASQPVDLVVYQPDGPLTVPSKWEAKFAAIPWKSWLENGFGFLVLWLTHLVAMNLIGSLERWSMSDASESGLDDEETASLARRFTAYRWTARLASLSAAAALAFWMTR